MSIGGRSDRVAGVVPMARAQGREIREEEVERVAEFVAKMFEFSDKLGELELDRTSLIRDFDPSWEIGE